LNWWGKKETFPVKILVDFYFFDIAEYERDKQLLFHSPILLKVLNSKPTF
jgi:hypothetical protein